MFVEFSLVYFSDVALTFNLSTKHIYHQYHVESSEDKPPSFWNTVDLKQNTFCIPLGDNSSAYLDKDLITPNELEERSCLIIRQA